MLAMMLAHLDRPPLRSPKNREARVIGPRGVLDALDLELQAGHQGDGYLGAVTLSTDERQQGTAPSAFKP